MHLHVHVSVHCCLVFCTVCQKKLMFVPVASALTGAHRDCLVLASFAQQPEIQHLVSQGQIVSADLLLLTDRHMTITF